MSRLKSPRILYPVATLLAATAAAALLIATGPELEHQPAAASAPSVDYIIAKAARATLKVHAQGSVEPRTEAALVPEVSGTVVEVSPQMVSGGRFEQGDWLVRIDDRDYRYALAQARAALEGAGAELEHGRYEHERLSKLLERNLASRTAADGAQRALRAAQAGHKQAQAAVARAELDLQRTGLRAPFSGRVRSEEVDVGQFVDRGERIAVLYATDYVDIRLPLADRQLGFLAPGVLEGGTAASAPVRIRATLGGQAREWRGFLHRTEGEIDRRSRMIHVVARVSGAENAGQPPLPVGLFVQAEIQGRELERAYTLPRAAIRDGRRVLVIDAENRLRFREVEILRIDDESVIVGGGLRDGERICVSQLQAAVENMAVKPSAVVGAGAG
ncbi:MAG: efflux RND transporter periplasmic adaptor subunit [Gammaproteobacteria bacterium]